MKSRSDDIDLRIVILGWIGMAAIVVGSIWIILNDNAVFGYLFGLFSGVGTLVMGVLTAFWWDTRKPWISGYCSDCGQKKVLWEAQRGFNAGDGSPEYKRELRCLNWAAFDDRLDMDARERDSRMSGNCGKRVTTPFSMTKCLKHTSLDTSCSACLAAAVKKGTYTPQEAQLLTEGVHHE